MKIMVEDKYGWPIEESVVPQIELEEEEVQQVNQAALKKGVNDILSVMWGEIGEIKDAKKTDVKKTESLTVYDHLEENVKDDLVAFGKTMMLAASLMSAFAIENAGPNQSQASWDSEGELAQQQQLRKRRASDSLNDVKKAIDQLRDFGHKNWGWKYTDEYAATDTRTEPDKMSVGRQIGKRKDDGLPVLNIGIKLLKNEIGSFAFSIHTHQVIGDFDKASGEWKIELERGQGHIGYITANAIVHYLNNAAQGDFAQ